MYWDLNWYSTYIYIDFNKTNYYDANTFLFTISPSFGNIKYMLIENNVNNLIIF